MNARSEQKAKKQASNEWEYSELLYFTPIIIQFIKIKIKQLNVQMGEKTEKPLKNGMK